MAAIVLALALVGGLLGGCGGGDSDMGAAELARQHEIAAARQDAARSARQSEHLRRLQREVAALKHDAKRGAEAAEPAADGEPAVAPPEPPPAPAADDWPGGSAYTAILASLGSESEARQTQSEATRAGLDAGVLFSSDYASLRRGYWVVFSGSFSSVGEAAERVARAQSLGYGDAYPRFVSP